MRERESGNGNQNNSIEYNRSVCFIGDVKHTKKNQFSYGSMDENASTFEMATVGGCIPLPFQANHNNLAHHLWIEIQHDEMDDILSPFEVVFLEYFCDETVKEQKNGGDVGSAKKIPNRKSKRKDSISEKEKRKVFFLKQDEVEGHVSLKTFLFASDLESFKVEGGTASSADPSHMTWDTYRSRSLTPKISDQEFEMSGCMANAVTEGISKSTSTSLREKNGPTSEIEPVPVGPSPRLWYDLLNEQVTSSPSRTPLVKGGMLADEMGLGKTCQVIGLILLDNRYESVERVGDKTQKDVVDVQHDMDIAVCTTQSEESSSSRGGNSEPSPSRSKRLGTRVTRGLHNGSDSMTQDMEENLVGVKRNRRASEGVEVEDSRKSSGRRTRRRVRFNIVLEDEDDECDGEAMTGEVVGEMTSANGTISDTESVGVGAAIDFEGDFLSLIHI